MMTLSTYVQVHTLGPARLYFEPSFSDLWTQVLGFVPRYNCLHAIVIDCYFQPLKLFCVSSQIRYKLLSNLLFDKTIHLFSSRTLSQRLCDFAARRKKRCNHICGSAAWQPNFSDLEHDHTLVQVLMYPSFARAAAKVSPW